MIRTTYRGRELKVTKSRTPGCVKTHVNGHVINHGDPVSEACAFDTLRRIIDKLDTNGGPGHNPRETSPFWYEPGTYDVNGYGHATAPGGVCPCPLCEAQPDRNQPADPDACRYCRLAERPHARQHTDGVGWHAWTAPTIEQTRGRMRARHHRSGSTGAAN
ncbi:hypothetical protein J7I98_23630 [Streptomyces sp. ISL-98]|uniref:hypothetical protein n=1 Tax=Streptomyces sp. ISL-98 TaxID=2819192 RepID=UPI001BE5ACEB|nr:hypothetical protein [Streptomyces sp. ISL-98]MBT2508822.1 hypothetical protein [Streptomyces sp. ISL-98]